MSDLTAALPILEKLIAFDTTSRNSNLECIEWIETILAGTNATCRRVPNADGTKTNLFATIGPDSEGGIILSGHSDVVPVDGQAWSSDPWHLTSRGDRLFGRGTCDMKGFLALALANAPRFAAAARPVHLAISYDEEVGCQGAPAMIAQMAGTIKRPQAAIIGEPSMMRIIDAHKGIAVHEVRVTGHEAHSSLTHLGISANTVAVELMAFLTQLAKELEQTAASDNGFEPSFPTLTIGTMEGGTAANILAGRASFVFDLRCPPGYSPDEILRPFHRLCETTDAELKSRFAGCGIEMVRQSDAPPLTPHGNEAAVALVRKLTGENGPAQKVAYAAEAGQFSNAGFPTVICGPGSIEQAHQPDEFIALDQLEQGQRFMDRLAQELAE